MVVPVYDPDAVVILQNRKLVTSVALWQDVDQLYLYTRIRTKYNEALRMEVLPWDGQVRGRQLHHSMLSLLATAMALRTTIRTTDD